MIPYSEDLQNMQEVNNMQNLQQIPNRQQISMQQMSMQPMSMQPMSMQPMSMQPMSMQTMSMQSMSNIPNMHMQCMPNQSQLSPQHQNLIFQPPKFAPTTNNFIARNNSLLNINEFFSGL